MDYAVRQEACPSHSPGGKLLGESHELRVREDNRATLAVVEPGRNPAMRYLRHARRVLVQWSREQLGPTV
eukprot:6636712-Alexandrium_andersonii.AAC.1